MGGQFNYNGLWLESDLIHGHSKGKPCSTFGSPRLSKEENFVVEHVEVRRPKVQGRSAAVYAWACAWQRADVGFFLSDLAHRRWNRRHWRHWPGQGKVRLRVSGYMGQETKR